MKKFLLLCAITLSTLLVGCSEPVPPGYAGIVVTKQGIAPEIYGQGRATVWGYDRLVLIETASVRKPANLKVIMADRYVDDEGNEQVRPGVEMDFILNVRFRVDTKEDVLHAALKDMKLGKDTNTLAAMDFYNKYGYAEVGQVGREILGKYTPEEVLASLDEINKALYATLKEKTSGTPLQISQASLGPVKLPDVIQGQIDLNKKTALSETQRRAQQKIDLLEKQNEIELAKQQAVREEVDARSLAEQNRILNKSITPEVLRLRELHLEEKRIEMEREVLRAGLDKGNSSVFIPYGTMNNPGAQMRMFQK